MVRNWFFEALQMLLLLGTSTQPYLLWASPSLMSSSSLSSSRLTILIYHCGLKYLDCCYFVFSQESLPAEKRSATSLLATAKSYIHPLHLFRLSKFDIFFADCDSDQ